MAMQPKKYVMGTEMIKLLAPMVGVDPNVCRTIVVHANYQDVAVFTVELLATRPPAGAATPAAEGATP